MAGQTKFKVEICCWRANQIVELGKTMGNVEHLVFYRYTDQYFAVGQLETKQKNFAHQKQRLFLKMTQNQCNFYNCLKPKVM